MSFDKNSNEHLISYHRYFPFAVELPEWDGCMLHN